MAYRPVTQPGRGIFGKIMNALTTVDPVLPALTRAREALAVAYENRDAKAAKEILDQAEVVRVYTSRIDGAEDLAVKAAEIKVRAVWTLGRILAAMKEAGELTQAHNRAKSTPSTSLKDMGITRDLSSQAQRVAQLTEAEVDERASSATERREPVTMGGLVSEVKQRERKAKKKAKTEDLKGRNEPLPVGERKYQVIYADPPWRYDHAVSESREIENQYPTMTLEEIEGLPVGGLCADGCVLFMWATSPKLAEAMGVISAWGFTYRTCAVWDKMVIGMGYYFRQQHELLLVSTKGKPGAPCVSARRSSVIQEKRGKHSAKPLMVYGMIESMYPDAPRIELFSRVQRRGWDAWGNQADAHV